VHPKQRDRAGRATAAACGFALGVLLIALAQAIIPSELRLLGLLATAPVAGSVGALLALGRGRWLLGALGILTGAGLLVIICTPLAGALAGGLARIDSLAPADAVVALSAGTTSRGEPSAAGQLRLEHAYELLGQRLAPRLVITRGANGPSELAAVRRQMGLFHLPQAVEEVGPTLDTHDEALAVARRYRESGWKQVILVSEPAHMRRAAAVFARAGVTVLCSPSASTVGSLERPRVQYRLRVFGLWVTEAIGYQVYRARGWL
jgi:uncharacterized SAM-binding protein YcdF (DUF218 family)